MKTHITFLPQLLCVKGFLNFEKGLHFGIFLTMLLLTSLMAQSQKPFISQVYSDGLQSNVFNDAATRKISVYLPPGYSETPDKNYPVIYLLSSEKETNNEWFRTMENRNLVDILDNSIHSGKINPVIVVSVDCMNRLQGCWYTNSEVTGNWEDFIVTDLIGYVDQNFRTLPFAAGRGIAGNSMGGYGALKLATKYPGLFSTVYAMNAFMDFQTLFNDTIIWKASVQTAIDAENFPTSDDFANGLLAMSAAFSPDLNSPPLYGKFPLLNPGEQDKTACDQWLQHDPMQMITEYTNNLQQLKSLVIDCDVINKNIMFNGNYSEALTKNNIAHTFLHYNGNTGPDVLQRVEKFMLPEFSGNLVPSLLQVNSHYYYSNADHLNAWLNTDGKIYIFPMEAAHSNEEMDANKLMEIDVTGGKPVKVQLAGLSRGIYKAVGVSSSGFTGKPYVFGINEGIPTVKVSITDFTTGKPIDYCDVKINDVARTQDADGNFYSEGAGIHKFFISKDKYCPQEFIVMVYTDTTFNFQLVKDSYLEVLEKGYGKPVQEASVVHNGSATLTGPDGKATVQNLGEGVLDCRIFKAGYFTEVVNVPLQPGETTTVELTLKQASINFILLDEQGKGIPDAVIKIAGKILQTDENGRVSLENLETRQEYPYSISKGNFEALEETIYLEADITIARQLWEQVNTAETFTGENVELMNHLFTGVKTRFGNDLQIYPNPAKSVLNIKTGTTNDCYILLSDLSGRIVYNARVNETLHTIDISSFNRGYYLVTLKSGNYSAVQKIIKQ